MKSTLQLSLLLLTLVSFNLAAQTERCRTDIVETAPASRFTINGDGTVTDRQTSLIWARCPQGLSGEDCEEGTLKSLTWPEALNLNGTFPTSVTTGPTDWRLPNIKELQSLVERSCSNPAINAMVFPNSIPSAAFGTTFFWSASPATDATDVTDETWGVGFDIGAVTDAPRIFTFSVRLVRGGR